MRRKPLAVILPNEAMKQSVAKYSALRVWYGTFPCVEAYDLLLIVHAL